MTRNATCIALILLLIGGVSGCRGREAATTTETSTMSPATPPEATDTETVATQTTEIGEERSANEGGVLTDPDNASAASPSPSPSPSSSPEP